MSVVCPLCGKDDAIQKISSIVAAGEAEGTFSGPTSSIVRVDGKWGMSGGVTSLYGKTMTVLAKKLQMPEPPQREGIGCLAIGCGGYLGSSMLCVALGAVVQGMDQGNLGAIILGLVIAAIVVGGVGVIYQKEIKPKREEAERKWLKEMEQWERAKKKWERSYYCFRDDIVFDPETGESADAGRLQEFLFE